VTVSILDALAVTPTGEPAMRLSIAEFGRYLAETADTKDDKDREARHMRRDDIYSDGGVEHLEALIEAVFKDPRVRQLRKEWAPYTRFNNALKRIINEISTLYAEPAQRRVNGDENNAAYRSLLERLQFDAVAQQINRLFNLHRVLLVGFRVRRRPDDTREPVVDVVTPRSFRVVVHPNDATMVLGYLIRTSTRAARGRGGKEPAWVFWGEHECGQFTAEFSPIEGTWKDHGFGVCPYVHIARGVGRTGFWPGEEGEDLVAAAVAIWFAGILLLKETKSATKQTIVAGDVGSAIRDQPADSEVPSQIPDGVAVNTVDMSMDLTMFRDTIDHILESVANAYGMSAALVKHQGTQSADARELMRVPLRELRREQQPLFRLFERRFAEVMAAVLKVDAPDLKFETEGWAMDFGEVQTPLMPNEELDLFLKKRAAGLDSTIEFVMRHDPDKTRDQAMAFVLANIDDETWRVREMRELQALSGAMGEAQTGTVDGEQPDNTNASPEDQAA